jgi:EmrB/QacA subfamily drug resistance transporter
MGADGKAYERRWWTLGVLALALLTISIDNTILNVAIPSIGRDLDASASQLQWIVDAYTLVFAGLLLTMGSLGDGHGRRRGLILGLVIFGLGSALSAMAPSAEALIGTRALMGVGGALIMPSTLSVLTNLFPADERPKAIGMWAAVAGLGIAIGPVTGGFLIEHFHWSAVFLVNLPVVFVALAAMRVPGLVPESRDPKAGRLDLLGAGLSIAGLTALVWTIIEAPDRGWTSSVILVGFGLAALFLAAFVAWELRAAEPMLDVRLFKIRRFSGASASIALVFFALFGAIFFLTQYLQDVMGLTPFHAGLAMVPAAAGMMPGSRLSPKLAARLGTRVVVASGLLMAAMAMLVISGLDASSSYGTLGAALVLMGLGMGFTMAPATASVMGSLPREHAGVGSAMNDTVRMVGGSLGVAILGSLLSSSYRADMQGHVEGLPPDAAHAASDSIGGAGVVADKLGGHAGQTLNHVAEAAFSNAMGGTLTIAAGVAIAGSVIALLVLPGRTRERRETGQFAIEGAGA